MVLIGSRRFPCVLRGSQLITVDNSRILPYTVSGRFVATKNQVKLLWLVEETATRIESYSSSYIYMYTVNIWSGARASNPAYEEPSTIVLVCTYVRTSRWVA